MNDIYNHRPFKISNLVMDNKLYHLKMKLEQEKNMNSICEHRKCREEVTLNIFKNRNSI